MKIPVILRKGESGWIVATAPTLPGCHSQGKTRKEALQNIQEAIELCLLDADGIEQSDSEHDDYEFVELNVN